MASQRGLGLVELMLVAAVATLLAAWGAGTLAHRMDEALAQSGAAWMLSVRQALHSYLERYGPVIAHAEDRAALGAHGYADWSAPELHELKADRLLSQGFPEHVSPGGGASIKVLRQGACPGPGCHVEGLVHSKQPFLRRSSGQVDEHMVAQWLLSSKGWGAAVSARRPEWIQGPAFRFGNPSWPGPALAPGSVAMAVTREHLREFEYLRVGDLRDPDFRADAGVAGELRVGAGLDLGGYLRMEAGGAMHQACAADGAFTRDPEKGLLMCRNGAWRAASRAGGGGFSINQFWGCANSSGMATANPLTGSCSCPPATYLVQISDSGPQAFPEGRTQGYLCVD
ncbi:hypothetical protein [Parapusillimonas granuli]|uniref:Uncharacterized protein n=1 Tax=Parapusillimonas granuli TaxID=380911 RepID=A0A853FZ64_9BURK|nr:hypothetical protein [Parapusillimonas granuli]MBB5217038.1 hypothetical protein [Parapusillimonas granuli]MEB2400632.1 hypothetical protein [Alcaligenaceae bacterium]NYT50198.1 hypothetical protein [Parapusillimonas granuli]